LGSCAEAFRPRLDARQAALEPNIVTGGSGREFRAIVGEHGYLSCWTFPFFSYEGALLGVFTMYAKPVRQLSDVELRLADIAVRIARIAIERKAAETRIHFMATHDALTGLANRSLLEDRLAQAILYAQRYDRTVAVVFLDLDNFKLVNDSLGHGAGDDLLKQIAARLVDCVRNSDTVVRLGGDEFVIVLLDQQKDSNGVSVTLQKLRAAIARPLTLQGRRVQVTSSIGVAQYPEDGEDGATLLANADAAMYRAKEIGRDNFQFYTPELNKRVHEKFILLGELRNAVARREFILHYQPKADLRTGRVFGLEALVRWIHPTLGLVPPAEFIPLAEETGLIVQIGDWVLREVCRQIKAWQDAGLPCLTVSVNVSPRQFTDADLIDRVTSALASAGLEAKYLELEVTESLVMQNVQQAVAKMKQLQALGLQFAIDDFGIGYSNLSALKAFPIARLKIDRSFIVDLSNNENDRAVASAVISLGQKLNLRVVAEGVETEAQMVFLRDNNCDEIQGFHFSKPLSVEDVEAFMLSGKSDTE
jgi:diguanylate cyclase (GGDEF)-like protein